MANLSDKRIIYIQDNGVVAVICPADNCGLTIEEIQSRSVVMGLVCRHRYVVYVLSGKIFQQRHIHVASVGCHQSG